jgi:hypothetical protein
LIFAAGSQIRKGFHRKAGRPEVFLVLEQSSIGSGYAVSAVYDAADISNPNSSALPTFL